MSGGVVVAINTGIPLLKAASGTALFVGCGARIKMFHVKRSPNDRRLA